MIRRLLICLSLIVATVFAGEGSCDSNTKYRINGSLLVINGTGISTCKFCERISDSKYVTTVIIESGVTGIGDYSFQNCENLENVTMASTVVSIGEHAFRASVKIKSFNVDGGNPVFSSEDGILYNKAMTKLIAYPRAKAAQAVPVIRSSVTTIGSFAFANYSGENITIPSTVTTIEYGAFADCHYLKTFYISGNNFQFDQGFLMNNDGRELYFYPISTQVTSVTIPDSVRTIWDYAFSNGHKLVSINLNQVEYIGSYAFYGCSKLDGEVTIPDSVTFIGTGAFQKCDKITSVKIGNGVTTIENYTFASDKLLTSVKLGNNVKSVGCLAFDSSNAMTFEEYENGLYLGSESKSHLILFKAKSNSVTSCKVHSETVTITEKCFDGISSLTSLTISDSVKVIEKYAFRSTGLETLSLGNGVEFIDDYAFYGIKKISTLNIPNSVTTIGVYAFHGTTGSVLTTLKIGNQVEIIGDRAFEGNRQLKEVDIPNSVTTIGSFAFASLFGMKTLKIGKRVSTIDYSTFIDAAILETIKVDSENPSFKSVDNVLYDKDGKTLILCAAKKKTINIESTVTSIGNCSLQRCDELKYVTFPKSVTSLGADVCTWCTSMEAFYVADGNSAFTARNGCLLSKDGKILLLPPKGKKTVKVPDSVTEISDSAFSFAKSSSVIMGDNVKIIGNNAFYSTEILELSLGSGVSSIGSNAFSSSKSLEKFCYFGKKDLGVSGIFAYTTNLKSVSVPLDYADSKFCTKSVTKEAVCVVTGESESDSDEYDSDYDPHNPSGTEMKAIPSSNLVIAIIAWFASTMYFLFF